MTDVVSPKSSAVIGGFGTYGVGAFGVSGQIRMSLDTGQITYRGQITAYSFTIDASIKPDLSFSSAAVGFGAILGEGAGVTGSVGVGVSRADGVYASAGVSGSLTPRFGLAGSLVVPIGNADDQGYPVGVYPQPYSNESVAVGSANAIGSVVQNGLDGTIWDPHNTLSVGQLRDALYGGAWEPTDPDAVDTSNTSISESAADHFYGTDNNGAGYYGGAYGYAGDQAFSGGSYSGGTYGGAYGYAGDQAFSGGSYSGDSYGGDSYSGDSYGGAYGYSGDQAFSGGSYGGDSYGGAYGYSGDQSFSGGSYGSDSYGGGESSYGGDDSGASGGGGAGYGGPTGSYGGYGGDDGGDGGGDGGDGGDNPILLDISGNGIKITELNRSSMFLDATGSGLSNRTAWAGAGTAVLFFDPNGLNKIVDKNQYVFTQWDPTATSDLQALRDVFDSNGDGVFNSSDAKWSQFKVMVTNADGTTTVETLAQAGITSINLKGDTTDIVYSDGSAITGETTFTRSNGTTGMMATTTLAYDAQGHAVTSSTVTSTVSGVTTTTITNTGTNSDGSVAFVNVQTTVVNGTAITRTNTYDDNGDGVIDRKQVIATTVDGSGNTTELWTNYNGGGTKLSAVQTVTSADGKTITISRDATGGGWYNQVEVQFTAANGTRTDTITNLNQDGSEISRVANSYSADGLTNTVTTDFDSDGVGDRITTDTIVNNSGGSRTETVAIRANNGSLITGTQTATSADGKTITVYQDLNGDASADLITQTAITINADGTSTSVIKNEGYNLSAFSIDTVTKSADGLSTTTSLDINGDGLTDRKTVDNMVINADGSRDNTVSVYANNGSLLNKVTTHLNADQVSKTVSIDIGGDGKVDETETVSINATSGVKIDTTSFLAPSGTLLSQTIATTSADGLTTTTNTDVNGDGAVDVKTVDATVHNANGTSTETVGVYSNTSVLIDQTVITTSTDSLTTTIATDINGDGTTDRTTVDQKVNNADGSITETVSITSGNGSLLGKTVTTTSADRRTQTITDYGVQTVSGSNVAYVKSTENITVATNGLITDLVAHYAINGMLINRLETTTFANELGQTTYYDETGHGNAWDGTSTKNTYYTTDGAIWNANAAYAANGAELDDSSIGVAGNGSWSKAVQDINGDATYDHLTQTSVTYWNDGSSTTYTSLYNGSGSTMLNQTQAYVTGNGLTKITTYDLNGDGTVDQTRGDWTSYNSDGTVTENISNYTGTATGTARDMTIIQSNILVANVGRETAITHQWNGSVSYSTIETIAPTSSGEVDDLFQTYTISGTKLLRQTEHTVSGNGLIIKDYTDVNGDFTWDYVRTDAKVINTDGSTTETISLNNASVLLSETVTTISGNGLSKTTSVDVSGTLSGSNPAFDRVTTDNTVINADGSQVETVTAKAKNGSTETQSVTTVSGDQLTTTTNRYLNETGTITHIDQTDVDQIGADGSLTDTLSTWAANAALLSTIITSTSANGLASTRTYKNGSGSVTDTQASTEVINSDGSTTTTLGDSDVVSTTATLSSSDVSHVSGNGLSSTNSVSLSGALASGMASSYTTVATSNTSVAASGVTTTTTSNTVNGSVVDSETITLSANELVQTTSLSMQGASSAFYQDQKTENLDGSTTEVTTFYNPSSLTTILEQSTTNVSWDQRTTVTSTLTDYDAPASQVITINHAVDNNSAATVTPTFAQTYNTITDTFTRNANATTTDQISGTGAFGTGGYSETVTWSPNVDAGQSLSTVHYDANGFLLGGSTKTTNGNDLSAGMAMDYTGLETSQNLGIAAGNLEAGTTPTNLLASDTIATQVTVLNSDGTKTTTNQFQLANGGTPILLEKSVTTVSANGLVSTTQLDNDGNGIFERVDAKTSNPDGSSSDIVTYYGNTSATNSTVAGSNTYSTSANGLISTLTTSTGISDTTTDFANSNGSYEWSRVVTAGSAAATAGYKASSATHFVDGNGLDTWTDFDGITNTTTTLVIDEQLEKVYLSTANTIAETILGHGLDNAQNQYVSHFITNGVLNREQLAYWLLTSGEYANNFEVKYTSSSATRYTASVIPFFENILGRMPNAEELAIAEHYLPTHNPNDSQPNFSALAQAAVAVAEYASQYDQSNNKVLADTNVSLLLSGTTLNPTAPSWLANGAAAVQIQAAGTYAYSATYLVDFSSSSAAPVSATINGNGNILEVLGSGYGTLTLNGVGNSVEVYAGGTITTSSSEIMVNGGAVAINGSYNEIYAASGTTISDTGSNNTISTISGSTINLSSNSMDTITGSGSTLNLATGDNVKSSGNTINIAASASVTVTGSGDTITGGTGSVATFGVGSTDTVTSSYLTLNEGTNSALTLNGTHETVQYGMVTGSDTLTGFASSDLIQFSHLTFANWSALQGAMTQSGSNTLITLDASDTVTLTGITKTSLVSSEFRFA